MNYFSIALYYIWLNKEYDTVNSHDFKKNGKIKMRTSWTYSTDESKSVL